MILNDITQYNNTVLVDDINKTLKLHKLDSITEEAVSTFQSVVEAEQRNGENKQKRPPEENGNPDSRSNQEHGMDKYSKRRKGV